MSNQPPVSVLIVDDDHWTTKAVAYAFQSEPGFDVLPPVHSGSAAIANYKQHQPDVVLMDINMPDGLSGIDATRAIKQFDPDATVVILSTVSPGPGIARALEAGAIAVVNKTASETTLRETVRSAAAGEDPALLRFLAREIIVSGDQLPPAPAVYVPQLTDREYEILTLICEGYGYEEIAEQQQVTIWTVKSHTKNLRQKLQAENLAQLVVRALQYKFYST